MTLITVYCQHVFRQARSTRTSRTTCCPRDNVLYIVRRMTFEMIKSILNICLATLRYMVEAVLKTCGVFVYGDICCVTNSFRINVLNTATHSLCCELHCFIHFSYYCQYVIVAHDVQKNIHVPLFMQLCYTYWFFNLCTAFRVVRMQTKFCRRWQKVQRTCCKALVVFCVRKSWWSTLAYKHVFFFPSGATPQREPSPPHSWGS